MDDTSVYPNLTDFCHEVAYCVGESKIFMCVRSFVRPLVRPSGSSILDLENGDTRAQTLKKRVPSRHLVPDLRDRSRSGVIAEF